MATFEDVQRMVVALGFVLENVDEEEQLFTITNESRGICGLVVDCEDDIVILEQTVGPMPKYNVAHHFKNLLRANRELVHGAYTNNEDQSTITWRYTLRLANLDLDEVEGSLNALSYGLCEHADMLVSMSYDYDL